MPTFPSSTISSGTSVAYWNLILIYSLSLFSANSSFLASRSFCRFNCSSRVLTTSGFTNLTSSFRGASSGRAASFYITYSAISEDLVLTSSFAFSWFEISAARLSSSERDYYSWVSSGLEDMTTAWVVIGWTADISSVITYVGTIFITCRVWLFPFTALPGDFMFAIGEVLFLSKNTLC